MLLQIEEINEGEDTCILLPVALWPQKVSHRISSGKRPNCVCGFVKKERKNQT